MTTNAVRTVAAVAIATLVASAPAAAQVSRGQQIEVLGTTYEIVSFEFRAFGTGELYELLLPTAISVHDDGSTSLSQLDAVVQVWANSSSSAFCVGEEANRHVSGFSAFFLPDLPHYTMAHSYTEYGDTVQGHNSLSYVSGAGVSIRINEATCVLISVGSPLFGHHVDQDVDRGIHSLAGDYAPGLTDLERYREEQLTLLRYVYIVRR